MAYINTRAKQSQGGEWGKLADAEFARFRIVCEGSDADHVKYPAAVTDVPFGITKDGCEAAEDAVALAMLGRGETQIVKVSEEVDKGDPLCPAVDGSGEARLVPATPGAYWLIGEALEDGAEDQEIAVDDRRPKLVGAWDADSRQFSVPAFAGDPTTPLESSFWYDLTNDRYRGRNGTALATFQVVEDA